jgi:nucleotide-binding universal stress UspA family protein
MARANGNGPIVFAYDGSDPAKASIREAGRLLGRGRASLVVTIWELVGSERLAEAVEADAERVAHEGAELARAAGFTAEALARGGEKVWRDIIEAADERDASLVVLGAHGRNGVVRAVMGSVATAVAQHGTRPMLLVHAP